MYNEKFTTRHNGPGKSDVEKMLKVIGEPTLDSLIANTVPNSIRLTKKLNVNAAMSEFEYLNHIREVGAKNKVYKSYIGLGYYNCITPSVIKRNVFENPGWYTAYTPYQAEISQGRLEALLNFQTMVCDLTAMPIANASLLDEGTAAAEAMNMLHNNRTKEAQKNNANQFFVDQNCFPQTIAVLRTRALPLGIELIIGNYSTFKFSSSIFGALLQYPDANGSVNYYADFVTQAHANNAHVVVAADLLSLTLLTPPGEWGADVVVGTTQRFGVPMGYGGPHAAYFATKEDFKRSLPGRIIGVTIDADGNHALRMALQTREQHIRREKATSNICTAQVLLAVMASMYAVYHGPKGLKSIATRTHQLTGNLNTQLNALGYKQHNPYYFDTLKVSLPSGIKMNELTTLTEKAQINFHIIDNNTFSISLDETTFEKDVENIVAVLANASKKTHSYTPSLNGNSLPGMPDQLKRTSTYLTHPIFNAHHSETQMMRYIKKLENKDISLTHAMISLGSCTMKLNAASEMYPVSYPEFANMHPFAPAEQAQGYKQIISELENALCEITGFAGVSLQPNSGAQGEYAGLLVVQAYHKSRNHTYRNIALIPSSAHGTNPASAVLAGLNVVVVKCDEMGNIDVADLKIKAEQHKENLSVLMATYPSTHGVFEEKIKEVTDIVHANGGQVYMDGANMNAQVGLTNPATIGADVCHLNLHKTFAIPHGGGGPGMGPIGVASHLVPFLPSHPVIKTGGENGIDPVSAAPWGSASILLISYGYIKMLGAEGITEATKTAILNANYLKARLSSYYPVLYQGSKGKVAHEMIIDCREFKKAHIEVTDIAKRLMDYGFHAPTVSFPVAGTLMIEPTESEAMDELDRFCEVMISIRKEIEEIVNGKADAEDNVLKNAPHTLKSVVADNWNHAYAREKAAFPLAWLKETKVWPTVRRVNDSHGDRNLVCSCLPIENYELTEA